MEELKPIRHKDNPEPINFRRDAAAALASEGIAEAGGCGRWEKGEDVEAAASGERHARQRAQKAVEPAA